MSGYLLDTHIVIWLADDESRLSQQVIDVLMDYNNKVYFSPINLWEMAIKKRQSHQDFQVDIDKLHELLVANGFEELTVTSRHVKLVEELPVYHKDPFDRLLIAQALSENLNLVTQDSKILQYDVSVLKN